MTEEEAKARKLSLLDAAVEVMKQLDEPLGAKDLTVKVIGLGLWSTKGKTPEATLYSALIREIANKGEQARFKKVSRGRFALTEAAYDA
jgi:restriction system protein